MKTKVLHLIYSLFFAAGVAVAIGVASADPSADPESGAAPAAPIQIHSFKSHSRLVFRVDEGVNVQWKEVPGGFELTFRGIGLAELGAPFGGEAEWARHFQAEIKDSRLAGISFKESAAGLVVMGRWKFPEGDQAPANAAMERFDYREKNPVQYVLDFWPKGGPTVAEVKATRLRTERATALRKAEEEASRRAERRLASEKARADAEDVTKFCRLPLAEDKDIFLSLIPVHEKLNLARWFPTTTADSEYIYLEPKGKTEEAQYVRLAHGLYDQGKPALVIKALDFFDKEHPNSVYGPEMRFLRANALIKLNLREDAMRILGGLVVSNPDSPVALHSSMYLSAKSAEGGSQLAALEGFLWLMNHYPTHRLLWVFHLGAAEALYALRQTERAAKEYQWVAMNAPEIDARAEAAMRMGDLYLSRVQHDRALGAYSQGLRYFKDPARKFPSIFINKAESLYGLAQFDNAETAFKAFLEEFPSHSAGWRATFRLGEIYGRRAGTEAEAESRKWFYETINRYPFSPGATLARARLLPCGDHGGFDLKASERFFDTEAAAFNGGGEVVMDHYRDFRGLSHVRSLITLGREDRAVHVAIQELQANARSEARFIVGDLLGILFRKSVLSMLAQDKKYEALTFYKETSGSLPKRRPGATPIEPDYLLKLSQAASDLGLGAMAHELVAAYTDARGGSRALANDVPTGETADIEAQLKTGERSFTEAKALWISGGSASDAKIRELLAKVPQESEYSFERELILGMLDEKAQKPASALVHAVRAQLLVPAGVQAGVEEDQARLSLWIATLQARAGNPLAAIGIYRVLERRVPPARKSGPSAAADGRAASLGLPAVPLAATLVMAEGELLARLGKWGEAAESYSRAMRDEHAGNQATYEYARALEKTSSGADHEKAQAALQLLAESKVNDFWKKLAREALANEKSGLKTKGDAKEGTK